MSAIPVRSTDGDRCHDLVVEECGGTVTNYWTFKRVRVAAALLGAVVVFASGLTGILPAVAGQAPVASGSRSTVIQGSVPQAKRSELLGVNAASGQDLAVTVVGDADGVTVLRGTAKSGYDWQPIATLSADGVASDRWIANWCLTANGTKLVVVYGTRTMINQESLMDAGAWASIVDVSSGAVTSLGRGYTMAYFNPSCGPDGKVALTAYEGAKTLIGLLDASTLHAIYHLSVDGEVTSATPDAQGNVIGVGPAGLVRYSESGSSQTLAKATGSVYSLSVSDSNVLTYISNSSSKATVSTLDLSASNSKPQEVASGSVTGTGIARDATGKLYLLGKSLKVTDPKVPVIDVPADAKLSSQGDLSIVSAAADVPVAGSTGEASEVKIEAFTTTTHRRLNFSFRPGHAKKLTLSQPPSVGADGSISTEASAIAPASLERTTGSPTNPVESERTCSIPRNDIGNQVLQPKPRQVEWAVDMAVLGNLTTTSANNLSNLGNPSFSPQGMFPLHSLVGGGHIPAQLVLGVLAQESNLWQADKYTSPGSLGNPLIGNFYGNGTSDTAFWAINFANADCGYGVGQITDGMYLPGLQPAGAPAALPAAQQRAIAIDYATNIARVVEVLADKWNQVANAGMSLNGGTAAGLEDWFFAVWAYNTGFHAQSGSNPWGVGWANNPINPMYNASRLPFLQYSAADAAHPQDWPYPEKVMGYAAWSESLAETVTVQSGAHPTGYTNTYKSGFNLAWWTSDENRTSVKPPANLFCTLTDNQCDPSTSAKCSRTDHECWWHATTSWKFCDDNCGHENVRFPYPTYGAAQADGTSLPGRCDSGGLPSGALVVDDVANSVSPVRAGCTKQASQGSFGLQFYAPNGSGSYPGKIDLHQQAGGFNDHFYFTHVRNVSAGDKTEISGTWNLGQSLTQWTRVFVHIPSYAAWSPQAAYKVALGDGTSETRTVNQRRFANEWVELGVFHMNGVPTVTMTNLANYADGFDDIAWDAVAFQPLTAKPANFVVSLGDSFSSGEGATTDLSSGVSYTSESDHDGTDSSPTNSLRDGCHRSTQAWSRKATLPGATSSIGAQADSFDSTLDYHLLACSGAVASNLQSGQNGQYGELNQIDQGYLDANTTLVTLSIGGNDMRFADILMACVNAYVAGAAPCNQSTLSGDSSDIQVATADRLANVLPGKLSAVLTAIHGKAPNARIVLMGYPMLFESGSTCVYISDSDRAWLNSVSTGISTAMSNAASAAAGVGIPVKFEDPQPFFSGHNLCTSSSAENGLVFTLTPGDKPMFTFPVPGPNFGVGVSQQAVHPNTLGTTYYAAALQDALSGFYP